MRIWTVSGINNAINNGKLLIIVKQKVYNIENVINTHPGGPNCLISHVGKDCSKDCSKDYYFHSNKTQKDWRGLCVGRLERSGISKFILGI